MQIVYTLIHLFSNLLIRGMCVTTISVILAGKLFNTDNRKALEIIRWVIVSYAVLNICEIAIGYFSSAEIISFSEQANDHYWWAFYIKLFSSTVLPLLLINKNQGRNKYVLLSISLLINLSWFFELTALYANGFYGGRNDAVLATYLGYLVLKGLLVGGIIYATGNALASVQQRFSSGLSRISFQKRA
ncbi:hypothetical protein INP83_02735 [Mucilaginibacter sp. 21P]|uniref:hypothetical protein n=1 Tax=Mucilaginibacter sp. 21P TaxID=2778902 RepID=UPI001C59B526|nr:hypothetical protein [Mucilaginibacter sp. 21P]QXV66029.1 hypothetical protein INP83_02735 [Mucilaginibacter sp. 21P]